MTEETRLGRVEITPTAIASIAGQAVLKSYGVVGLSSRSGRGLLSLSPDNIKKGVEINIIDNEIIIDLYVIIEYGTRISTVAHNIMQNVKFSVEKAMGVPVAQVNVHVQGLRVSNTD
mgnify:FL=1|jgi:uncharacterized alkaline shock family protein YloU